MGLRVKISFMKNLKIVGFAIGFILLTAAVATSVLIFLTSGVHSLLLAGIGVPLGFGLVGWSAWKNYSNGISMADNDLQSNTACELPSSSLSLPYSDRLK